MPIDLRHDLRLRSDRALADRLQDAWQQIDRLGRAAIEPEWWDLLHANRMQRGFIRHRSAYRVKAWLWRARCHLAVFGRLGQGALIFLPFYVLARLIEPRLPFPRPPGVLGEYDAFLLKCEIEDLQDEIQRRIDGRKRTR